MSTDIDETKKAIRRRVWDLLVAERVVERGVHGSIPAFVGAGAAADRLAALPEWRSAQVVNAVPDRAQQPVRDRALRDGKLLYVAVPRLAAELPFFVLDPADPGGGLADPGGAPTGAGPAEHAAHHARKVAVEDMRRVDIVVCGSVAVNRRGTRLGKGAGYADIAVALLQEAGRIGPSTVIVTTVHPLQVIDDVMPETEYDFSVDLIVTPDEVIECEPQRRPSGLFWTNLTAAKIAAIPVLAARAAAARRDQRPPPRGLRP